MGRLAREGAKTPLASFLSRTGVAGVPGEAPLSDNARALCGLVRHLVRYQTEDPETLVGLEALMWLGAGDCDDVAIVLGALLLRCGVPLRWAVGWQDGRAAHVWVQANAGDGWIDLDPSTYRVEPGTSPMRLGELDYLTTHDLNGKRYRA